MLIGMYEHLEQAHAAIRELQQLGLTSKEIGCAFEPSQIRVPTVFRRAMAIVGMSAVEHSSEQICNAEVLSRMILPHALRQRSLNLLHHGGALVSVHPAVAPNRSQADVFRVLEQNGAAEIVVLRNERRVAPRTTPRRKPAQETSQVKVLGALENLLEEPESATGSSGIS